MKKPKKLEDEFERIKKELNQFKNKCFDLMCENDELKGMYKLRNDDAKDYEKNLCILEKKIKVLEKKRNYWEIKYKEEFNKI